MSTKKAGGKTSQLTPRPGKRLGIKIFGGGKAKPGNILVRQRGTKFHAGEGVEMGRDHTLFAVRDGIVKYTRRWGQKIISIINPGS